MHGGGVMDWRGKAILAMATLFGGVQATIYYLALGHYGSSDPGMRIGIALYDIALGFVIGLSFARGPQALLKLPYWLRGPLIGIVGMGLLWLLVRHDLEPVAARAFSHSTPFASTLSILIDGALLGLAIGVFADLIGRTGCRK